MSTRRHDGTDLSLEAEAANPDPARYTQSPLARLMVARAIARRRRGEPGDIRRVIETARELERRMGGAA